MAEAARKVRYSSYGNVAYDPAYEGGAVRVPSDEPLSRPHVLPREHTLTRPKVQVRPAGQVSVFAVVGFLAVAAAAILVLLSYVRLTALSDEVVSLRSEYSALKDEESRLLAQYELAYDLKSIEAAVTADGRMVKPQSSQIYYMDLSGSDSVVVYETGTAATIGSRVEELMDTVAEYLP